MKFRLFIIILPFLWWASDVMAQLPEEETASSMPEQWQLTLDVIKSKAQTLVVENNGLQVEYRQLIEQVQKLQRSIDDQRNKNEQIAGLLKERNGQADQQARIGELIQAIKTKNQLARAYDEELGNLQRKRSDLDRKIQALKYMISDIELHQQPVKQAAPAPQSAASFQVDDQLSQLRNQLEDQSAQEVLLENQLRILKSGDRTQNMDVNAINSENKQLEARLDILRLQKLQHDKESSDTQLAQANARMYDQLKRHKQELEAKISAYEMRMDDLKQASLTALSWPLKKKRLVHAMVQIDARNSRLRSTIKVLREDIDVLKEQVARLERRVDFVQGQAAK